MATRRTQNDRRSLETLFNSGALGAATDPELLESFRADGGPAGQEAFRMLVERHGPMVLGVCRGLIGDPGEAEDAFQATFLVLVRKARSIRVRDSIGPWLYGVASRVARRARRRSIRRQRSQVPLAVDVADPLAGEIPGQASGEEPAIHEEIAALPERLREPVILCALEGLSYDAAARRIGVTEPTLRGRLYRARRRLEARLRGRGILWTFVPAAPEPFRLALPAPPAALVASTVQHAGWWSSVGGLIARESAIPPAVATMARDALRSMLVGSARVAGIAALVSVGVLGTIVLAQQRKPGGHAAPAVAHQQGDRAQTVPAAPLKSGASRQAGGVPAAEAMATLLRGRLDVARKGFELELDGLEVARRPHILRADTDGAYRWSVRWLEADRDLHPGGPELIAAHEAHLKRAGIVKQRLDVLYKEELVDDRAMLQGEWYILEARLWLERARTR